MALHVRSMQLQHYFIYSYIEVQDFEVCHVTGHRGYLEQRRRDNNNILIRERNRYAATAKQIVDVVMIKYSSASIKSLGRSECLEQRNVCA